MKTKTVYVLEWHKEQHDGHIGLFESKTMDQVANVPRGMFFDILKILKDDDDTELRLRFLESHSELNKLRKKRGFHEKPSL